MDDETKKGNRKSLSTWIGGSITFRGKFFLNHRKCMEYIENLRRTNHMFRSKSHTETQRNTKRQREREYL